MGFGNSQLATRARAWFLEDGYLWDWLAAAVLIIINHVIPVEHIKVRQRVYSPLDATLSYPEHNNTVPSSAMYVLTFIWPGLVFIAVATYKRSFADGHHALLSLAEGFALTCGWKRWMNLVGRLRPNWLSVLASGSASSINDARQAYPSGHSAYMFFSATILSLYLIGKSRVLAAHSKGQFAKLFVCLGPLVLATYVMLSRVADFKHDFADVNAGAFIGIVFGTLAYLLNFHSPLDPRTCHLPKLREGTVGQHQQGRPQEEATLCGVCVR